MRNQEIETMFQVAIGFGLIILAVALARLYFLGTL